MAWNVFQKKGKTDAQAKVKEVSSARTASPAKTSVVPLSETAKKEQGARQKFPSSSREIFVRPLITEKSLGLVVQNVYAFEVARTATKINVKKAFYNIYGVMPLDVRIANQNGKVVRFGRVSGKRKDWKKAFVKVPAGTTIDIQ